MKTFHRAGLGSLLAGGAAVLLTILLAFPAYATSDLNTVIDSLRNWVAGLLAALASFFRPIGAARYLAANGDPRAVEKGKATIKSADAQRPQRTRPVGVGRRSGRRDRQEQDPARFAGQRPAWRGDESPRRFVHGRPPLAGGDGAHRVSGGEHPDCHPFTGRTRPAADALGADHSERLIDSALERRGRSLDVVEVEIAARLGRFGFDDGNEEAAL